MIGVNETNGNAQKIKKYDNTNMVSNQTLFPFQVPTIGDAALEQCYSVDWQNMALYQFKKGDGWKYKMHVKHHM